MKANVAPCVLLRLRPGQELVSELKALVLRHKIEAAVVLSMVGSLSGCTLRFAGGDSHARLDGPLEIVSVTGTAGVNGLHVHLTVADKDGDVKGGHLVEGSQVLTTVELVLLDLSPSFRFERVHDPQTGYKELHAIARE